MKADAGRPPTFAALVALVAFVAFVALVALAADGTRPRLDSSTSAPVSESSATFVPVTTFFAIFFPVTAPLRSCLVPTLFFGSLIAA